MPNSPLSDQHIIKIPTYGQRLYDFTDRAQEFVQETSNKTGLLTVSVHHTSCSLIMQENVDPNLQTDQQKLFTKQVPDTILDIINWLPRMHEDRDDIPAHIKSALALTSFYIPIGDSQRSLGRRERLYLFEHRTASQQRQVGLHVRR